eukprot:m.54732 g.54732  ORF g.54732 m.54732 type:complete len:103 (-) comp10947_c0_seq1:387-695(-)
MQYLAQAIWGMKGFLFSNHALNKLTKHESFHSHTFKTLRVSSPINRLIFKIASSTFMFENILFSSPDTTEGLRRRPPPPTRNPRLIRIFGKSIKRILKFAGN